MLTSDELAHRYIQDVLQDRKSETLQEICRADLAYRSPTAALIGIGPVSAHLEAAALAFANRVITLDYCIGNHSHAFARITTRATHSVPWNGLPASFRRMTLSSVFIFRTDQGLIFDIETFYDVETLMSQIHVQAPRNLR